LQFWQSRRVNDDKWSWVPGSVQSSVSSCPKTRVTTRPRTLAAPIIPRTAGTPNFPFKIARTKTPNVAPILAIPAAKPLAVARNCVGNKMGARVNVVELGPAFIHKLNRMNPANTSGMCPAPEREFDRRTANMSSNMPKAIQRR
jgi:hypothetical protein